MRILSYLYEKVLLWSKHPKAPFYLGVVSFIDSSLFPISPLFMLLPMAFHLPERAFWFAFIATSSSLLGGIVGYLLGYFAFEAIVHPFLEWMGYMGMYQASLSWFKEWGFWAILIGCFSPFIPFKIFTIGAGVLQLPIGGFLLAASIGRTMRFFIIAGIIRFGGPKMEPFLKRTFAR